MTKREGRFKDADFQLDLLSKYATSGVLYDVGAAGGFFMVKARERGWRVRGNELSVSGVKWAKDNFDLDIFCGYLEEDSIEDESIDVFVMWNTLEHLDDPVGALNDCRRCLKQGGFLLIKVPNKSPEDIPDVERRYESLHLTEFSTKGLMKILNDNGFEVKESRDDMDCGPHVIIVAMVVK